jgi:phage tail sheath protein FI
LMARTAINQFPWFSPAGANRGAINNAVKLAYNPSKAQRDQLYPLRVNSIINQPGAGVILYGDKTALSYASAFDRINVRRMFLYCEKAVYTAMQAFVFENNTDSLRRQVVNLLNPFFNRIKNSEGLYDFLVKCDSVNRRPGPSKPPHRAAG